MLAPPPRGGVVVDPKPRPPEFPPRLVGEPTVLGSGGFATVFRVTDAVTGKPVAVKVLQRATYEEGFGSTLEAEVRATARLTHPGVVQLLDTGLTGQGQPFLVMEYADAGSFTQLVERPPPWETVRRLVVELLDTLAFIHARGVLHRDIKPENVLLSRDGGGTLRTKVADLGIAKLSEVTGYHHQTDSSRGTPVFMAPEQLEGGGLWQGPWTDIYAVGCLLYQVLWGDAPFEGHPWTLFYRKLADGPPPLRVREGYPVPAGIGEVVQTMMARSPDARYELAADARDALLALGDPAPPPPPPPEADPPDGKPLLFGDAPRLIEVAHPPFPERAPDDPRSPQAAGTSPSMFLLRRAPLVDREEPRERLWRLATEALRDGTPRVAALAGEAGVGKGRLALWLHEALERDGRFQTLFVDHDPEPGSVGSGVTEAVRRFLHCSDLEPDPLRQTLQRYLTRHGEEDPAELALMARWLGGDVGSAPDQQARTALLHRVLRRAAHRGGVMLWLNQVQWSPGGEAFRLVRDLLLQLALDPAPILIVLTVRPEDLASDRQARAQADELAQDPAVAWMTLDRLGLEDGRQLLQALLQLEDRLAERVWERAAGNPHFAVQIVATWLADGLLEEKVPLRWGLVEGAEAERSLPDSVGALWRNRIDGTLRRAANPETARRVLEATGLIGGPTTYSAVTAVLHAAGVAATGIRSAWAHLHGEGLLVTRRGETRLDNALLRETVLRGVAGREDAAALHRACAEGLRAWSVRSGRDLRGEIALHLLAAGSPGEALDDLLAAGGAAEAREVQQARRFYRAAGRAADDLGAPADDPRRVVALRGLGYTAQLLGNLEEAQRTLSDALSRSGEDVGGALVRCMLAEVEGMRGRFDRTLALLGDALELLARLEQTPEVGRVTARALGDRALALTNRGELEEAEQEFTRALQTGEAAGGGEVVLQNRWRLARLHRSAGDFRGALEGFTTALEESRDAGDTRSESVCLRELGNLALIDGDLEQARALFEQALALNRAGGHDRERLAVENSLGELARKRGDLPAARSAYRSCVAIALAYRDDAGTTVALGNLALTELAAGDAEAALQTIDRLSAHIADEPTHWVTPYRMGIEVAASAARGDWQRYERVLAEIAAADLAQAPDPDLSECLHAAADDAERAGRDATALRDQARAIDAALDASREG